jgi:hypothetical protein
MNRLLLLGSVLLFACSSGSSDGSNGAGTDASSGDDTLVASNDSSSPGDDTNTPGDDTAGGGTDTTTGSDGDPGAYPSGPYGNAVGSTFPNLQWVGYVDDAADVVATSEPFGPYSMDDVRKSGKPYAFVHVSEFY